MQRTTFSMPTSYFDQSAARWDNEPRRIALMKAVGEAILRYARPTPEMDVLDYGCGTGLVGLFLLGHVRTVTGADSSSGMLDILNGKTRAGGLSGMSAVRLDLERDRVPPERFHLIVSSMVMHHVADLDRVLQGFHEMLLPRGILSIADLDTEPGLFHPPEAAGSVYHHGFDRQAFVERLEGLGFLDVRSVTAHVVSKPMPTGEMREFPVFLMVGRRE